MSAQWRISFLAGALVTMVLLLAACAGGLPAGTPPAGPSAQPTTEPTAVEPGSHENLAAQRAAEGLAGQLGIEPSAVTVVSVTAQQWPDSCLGIHLPGQACAMHVVDGYRVVLEAQGNRYEYRTDGDGSLAVPALALTWHREGGIAGFCDDLVVYQTGTAVAMSCMGGPPQEIGRANLDEAQAGQLQDWLASLRPFEVDQTDQATADAMTIRLAFDGWGTATAGDADKQAIEAFAAGLYAEIAQQRPASISVPARMVADKQESLSPQATVGWLARGGGS